MLRDDGVSYGDYQEQLTYLIFLKMADKLTEEIIDNLEAGLNNFREVSGSLGKAG
jgi:hypothetical protein